MEDSIVSDTYTRDHLKQLEDSPSEYIDKNIHSISRGTGSPALRDDPQCTETADEDGTQTPPSHGPSSSE